MKLVLVVGPPRSGTSVTARILHEKLGVCMGHNLVPGNAGNPKGFYEEPVVVDALKTQNIKEIEKAIAWTHPPHEMLIGVKSPELAFVAMRQLNPALVIWTNRGIVYNAASLMRWQQPEVSYEEAQEMVMRYHTMIALNTRYARVHRIDLTHHRDEEDIEDELRSCLQGVTARIRGS